MKELILYFSLKYNGDFQKIYQAIAIKERVDEELKNELFKKFEKSKCNYVTLIDCNYPKVFEKIKMPPFVLYYHGNLNLINEKTVGVVGTHKPNNYGLKATNDIVNQLTYVDYTIVNGVANGIEIKAMEKVMNNKGKAIGVIGNGIDTFYPLHNEDIEKYLKENGLIISEYPFDKKVDKKSLDFRKRIISAFSKELLVIQAMEQSDTFITVGYSLEQGKDVYAVPSNYDSEFMGCNRLIEQGANLYVNVFSLQSSK